MKKRVKGIHDIATSTKGGKEKERSGTLKNGNISLSRKGPHERRKTFSSEVGETLTQPRVWAFCTQPKFKRYGKRIKRTLSVERIQEPKTNVFEKMEHLVILAELPEMNVEDIHWEVAGDILSIHGLERAGPRKYAKEILLPFLVEEAHVEASYRNGIFEIGFRRKREPHG